MRKIVGCEPDLVFFGTSWVEFRVFRHCFCVRANLPAFDARFVGNKIEDVEVGLVSHTVVVERESSVIGRYRRVLEYSTTSSYAFIHEFM